MDSQRPIGIQDSITRAIEIYKDGISPSNEWDFVYFQRDLESYNLEYLMSVLDALDENIKEPLFVGMRAYINGQATASVYRVIAQRFIGVGGSIKEPLLSRMQQWCSTELESIVNSAENLSAATLLANGNIYARCGNKDKAVACYLSVIGENPDEKPFLKNLYPDIHVAAEQVKRPNLKAFFKKPIYTKPELKLLIIDVVEYLYAYPADRSCYEDFINILFNTTRENILGAIQLLNRKQQLALFEEICNPEPSVNPLKLRFSQSRDGVNTVMQKINLQRQLLVAAECREPELRLSRHLLARAAVYKQGDDYQRALKEIQLALQQDNDWGGKSKRIAQEEQADLLKRINKRDNNRDVYQGSQSQETQKKISQHSIDLDKLGQLIAASLTTKVVIPINGSAKEIVLGNMDDFRSLLKHYTRDEILEALKTLPEEEQIRLFDDMRENYFLIKKHHTILPLAFDCEASAYLTRIFLKDFEDFLGDIFWFEVDLQYALIKSTLRKNVEINPAEYYLARGNVYARYNKDKEAVEAYVAALQVQGNECATPFASSLMERFKMVCNRPKLNLCVDSASTDELSDIFHNSIHYLCVNPGDTEFYRDLISCLLAIRKDTVRAALELLHKQVQLDLFTEICSDKVSANPFRMRLWRQEGRNPCSLDAGNLKKVVRRLTELQGARAVLASELPGARAVLTSELPGAREELAVEEPPQQPQPGFLSGFNLFARLRRAQGQPQPAANQPECEFKIRNLE